MIQNGLKYFLKENSHSYLNVFFRNFYEIIIENLIALTKRCQKEQKVVKMAKPTKNTRFCQKVGMTTWEDEEYLQENYDMRLQKMFQPCVQKCKSL